MRKNFYAVLVIAVLSLSASGVYEALADTSGCPAGSALVLNQGSDGSVSLTGSSGTGDEYLCLYGADGSRVAIGAKGNNSISLSADQVKALNSGTWNGAMTVGNACSNSFATSGNCNTSAAVTAGAAAAAGTTATGTATKAATGTGTTASQTVTLENPLSTGDFTTLVTNFLQWLLGIAGGIALLMLIYGGVIYITSTGDQQKADQGKRIVTWTLFGLMIILVSFSIVKVVEDIFVTQ